MLVIRIRKNVGEMCVSCWLSEISMMAWADGDGFFWFGRPTNCIFSDPRARTFSSPLLFLGCAIRANFPCEAESQTLFGSVLCL